MKFDNPPGKRLTTKRVKFWIRKGYYGDKELVRLKKLEAERRSRIRRMRQMSGRLPPPKNKPTTTDGWIAHYKQQLDQAID